MKHILLFLGITIGYHSFAQVTLIPDEQFEIHLLAVGIDSDGMINGQVATNDVNTVLELDVSGLNISDLTGIEDFAALEVFNCSSNLDLENLDISNNSMLRELYAEFCSFSTLDFSENSNLELLYIPHNNLTSLAFTNNPALETLLCGNPQEDIGPFNQITAIDFSGAPNLLHLDVSIMFENIAFDLSQIPLLEYFNGSYCLFTSLDFSSNPNLEVLNLGGYQTGIVFGQSNNLTEIDLSNNPNMKNLNVGLTNISSLNLSNGNNTILTTMRANLNDPLFCIQVDDETAANNGDAPYGNWDVDAQVAYSEDCILGVEENSVASFTLYPNPTTQSLKISSSNNLFPTEIQIYSVSGQLLLEPNLNNGSIDVSKLASGFYILKARFDTGFSSQTFIKQ